MENAYSVIGLMKITVYIPSYNQADLLASALDSVLMQTRPADEIWVVDDCSLDQSEQVVLSRQSAHPNLKFYRMQRNSGIAAVRSKALELANGDFITYVDGDDLMDLRKLEIESGIVEKERVDLVFSNFIRFKDDPTRPFGIWASDDDPSWSKNWFRTLYTRNMPKRALFRSELVRTSLMKEIGGYDSSLKIYEDFDKKLELSKHAKIGYTLLSLNYYRDNPIGLSKEKMEQHGKALEYILSKHAEYAKQHAGMSDDDIRAAFETIVPGFKERNSATQRKNLFNPFRRKK